MNINPTDISLKTTNVNLMVALEEKVRGSSKSEGFILRAQMFKKFNLNQVWVYLGG